MALPRESPTRDVGAVLWDFGGVIFASPFEGFNRYEERAGLPRDLIRRLNATDPDTNAWARFERAEISAAEFCTRFEAEARAAGHVLDAREVLLALRGEVRPEMLTALRRLRDAGFKTAGLTNNVAGDAADPAPDREAVHGLLDAVIESSKVGVRKPERRFYELACEVLGVRPEACAFLDDLGVNLKPAAAMGMRTIKVTDPVKALVELEAIVGIPLR